MEEKIKKVVILMDMPLFPYRIYCYNELAERGYDLTVVSVSNKVEQYEIPLLFKHKVCSSKMIGSFVKLEDFHIHDYDNYDFIVVDPNLRMLDYYRFYNKGYWNKLIGWGHLTGRTSSNKLAEKIRYLFFKKFKALVFYDAATRDEYIKRGFEANKLFVANNTQYVDPQTVHPNEKRTYFLYVGRIQERKGLDVALNAFASLKKKMKDSSLQFIFVGGGNTKPLEEIARNEGVLDAVRFIGPVHEQAKLGELFSHALAYVSPGHVGLGVLHSFACGVPVITCTGRLHSVEVYNCKADNSLLVPYNVEAVSEAMSKLYSNPDFQKKLSEAAYKYYWENCTIDKMVDGVDGAIDYLDNCIDEKD